MKVLHVAFAFAMLAIVAPAVHAQDAAYQKRTDVTFDSAVRLPGVSLDPGTYRFELADPVSDRKVVRISSEDGKKVYGLLLTVPDQSLKRPDSKRQPVVLFEETPAGTPAAARAWFYEGESIGYEFVYPRSEAMAIAKATHERVRSMEGSGSDSKALSGAKVGWVDENGDVKDSATATSGTGTPGSTDKR